MIPEPPRMHADWRCDIEDVRMRRSFEVWKTLFGHQERSTVTKNKKIEES